MSEKSNTTTTTSSTTSTTSTTTKKTITRYDMSLIETEYRDAIGHTMPQSIANWVQSEILLGHMDTEDILYALHETAMAPRPSWRYAMAIIRRLQKESPLPWER